ncbi:MAG: hypothetical protein U9Q03_03430 [Patescibacteria group bacterium]|nr:hypothetical protein [Patescibacteria group bacterium]
MTRVRKSIIDPKETPLQNPVIDIRVRGVMGPERGLLAREIREVFFAPPKSAIFAELTKGWYETVVIRGCVNGMNEIRAMIGLPPLRIPTGLVHVMNPAVFKNFYNETHGGDFTPPGFSQSPRTFIRRTDDRATFINVVSHELTHIGGYNMCVVHVDVDEDDTAITGDAWIGNSRVGMQINNSRFTGLNEALTEEIADLIRVELIEPACQIPRHLAEKALNQGSYQAQREVLGRVMEELFGDRNYGYKIAIWDYFTGSTDFLRTVRRKRPEMLKPLRRMDRTEISALMTAVRLGFREEVIAIKKIMSLDADS